jgi:hypothetical protein
MSTLAGKEGRFEMKRLQLRIWDEEDILFAPQDDHYYVAG